MNYGYEHNESGITLTDCFDTPGEIEEIPGEWKGKTVTAIGEELFKGAKQLRRITVPDTVTELGWWALRDCPCLTQVILPEGLLSIGYRAFSGCTALKEIRIPDTVTHIGEAAFWGCSSLKSIHLPVNLKKINNRTFYGCRHLTDIEIPRNVTVVEWGTFENCSGLRFLEIPDKVTEIGSNAIKGCSGLKELNLPEKIKNIDHNLFGHRSLPDLERGYIPGINLTEWDEAAGEILAVCYLTTRSKHSFGEKEQYDEYITSHIQSVGRRLLDSANIRGLEGLFEMGIPDLNDIDKWIEYSNSLKIRDAVITLLERKNTLLNSKSDSEQLSEKIWERFSL